MRVLIIIPGNEPGLERAASEVKQQLLSASKHVVVDIMLLDDFNSPAPIEQHDAIIIGTPTIKGDICWPLQVAIDGQMQKIQREQISKKIATGFTVSNSIPDSSRNIEAILWVFTENNARILEPLLLREGDADMQNAKRISDYVHGLKGIIF